MGDDQANEEPAFIGPERAAEPVRYKRKPGLQQQAPLPIVKADKEKMRKMLLTELRRQMPALLRQAADGQQMPDRAMTLIRTLVRLGIG